MTGPVATVFVVDDDASVCRSVSRLLRTFGYHVETFSGPHDFLERLPAHEPACLLLDARMPGLSGFDLLERLKPSAATSRWCSPPVTATFRWLSAR